MDPSDLLIKAQAITAMPGECKTHLLNPNAVRLNKSLGDAVGLQNLGIHLIEIEPGRESTEYHLHHYEEEAIYVLSGTGVLTIDGTDYPLGPGDFAGFPTCSVAHGMRNTDAEPLVCLVVGQRLNHDITDYPRQRKRLYRHHGEWNLVDLDAIGYPRRPQAK